MWHTAKYVTHTWNSCSAVYPFKAHTHSSEHTHTHSKHTPGAAGLELRTAGVDNALDTD